MPIGSAYSHAADNAGQPTDSSVAGPGQQSISVHTVRDMCSEREGTAGEVLRAMASGDPAAFERFVSTSLPRLSRTLRALFRRYSVPEDQVDDLVQETLLKSIRNLRKDSTREVHEGWLMQVGKTVLLDRVKKAEKDKDRKIWAEVEARLASMERTAEQQREMSEHVSSLLSQLPAADRHLVELLYLHECTIEEVAQGLGISVQAAYKRHARVLQRLRNMAAQLEQGARDTS